MSEVVIVIDEPDVVDITAQPSSTTVEDPRGYVAVQFEGPPGPEGPIGPVGPPGGTEIQRLASGAISGHRVVRSLGGSCAYASCDVAAHAEAVIGVTLEAAADGDTIRIASQEEIVEPSWSFVEGPVFLGLNGAIVQPAPKANQGALFIRQIGVAVAPDRLLVQLRPPIFIS